MKNYILKAGSWAYIDKHCRFAYRGWNYPALSGSLYGFRLVIHPAFRILRSSRLSVHEKVYSKATTALLKDGFRFVL